MSKLNTPRRHVRMFKAMFAWMVRDGRKRQTVRPWPKRVMDYPKIGDTIDCRAWTGAPYRSPQVKLGEGIIIEAEPVMVDAEKGIGFLHADEHLSPRWVWIMSHHAEAFARADGFADLAGMLAWFQATHGLPFEGVLIKWEPLASSPLST